MGNNYCQAKMHRRGPLFQHQLTIAKCSGVRSGGMGKSLPPPRPKKKKRKKGKKEEEKEERRKIKKKGEKIGKGREKENKITESG